MAERQILDQNGRPWEAPGRVRDAARRGDNGFALPQRMTYAALLSSAYQTYFHGRGDEARKSSSEDAKVMGRDAFLMGLLQERKLAVASLPWRVEVDDEKDARQKAVAEHLTDLVKRTPYFRSLVYTTLEHLWFGRYGVQWKFRWVPHGGRRSLSVARWLPVHGDKILYGWDGTPHVEVAPAWEATPGAEVVVAPSTDGSQALRLKGAWRERFQITHHLIEDSDFLDWERAENIYGIGIRDRVFWLDWVRREYMAWVSEWLEKVGLGITLWEYEEGNDDARREMERAAGQQSERVNVFLPKRRDGTTGNDVRRVDVPMTGADILIRLQEPIRQDIERYVVGQTLSSKTEGSGLGGTGVADLHADTKAKIAAFDAANLGEGMTGSADAPALMWMLQKYTFPETVGKFQTRLVFDAESGESREKLDSIDKVRGMGVSVKVDDIRAAAGIGKPTDDDEVIAGQQPGPGAPGLPGMPGMGGPGMPGTPGTPPPDGPDPDGPGGTPAPAGGPAPSAAAQPGANGQTGQGDPELYAAVIAEIIRRKELRGESEDGLEDADTDGPQRYLRDADLLLYSAEDWTHGGTSQKTGRAYSRKRWTNSKTGRVVYSDINPGGRHEHHAAQASKLEQALRAAPDADAIERLTPRLMELPIQHLRGLQQQLGVPVKDSRKLLLAWKIVGAWEKKLYPDAEDVPPPEGAAVADGDPRATPAVSATPATPATGATEGPSGGGIGESAPAPAPDAGDPRQRMEAAKAKLRPRRLQALDDEQLQAQRNRPGNHPAFEEALREYFDAKAALGGNETNAPAAYKLPTTPAATPPGDTMSKQPAAKAPHEMTQAEFRTAHPVRRGDMEDYVRSYVSQYKKGKPGVKFEVNRPDGSGEAVFRDEAGKPVAVVAFGKDAITDLASLPKARGKGAVSALLDAIEREKGLTQIRGPYTEAGAAVAHKRAVKQALAAGKTVSPEVLADYPDLAAKAQPATPATTPATAPATAPAAKEPWEMTRTEWAAAHFEAYRQPGARSWDQAVADMRGAGGGDKDVQEMVDQWADNHARRVEVALAAGKAVPAEVLRNYPDLAAGAKPAAAPPKAAAAALKPVPHPGGKAGVGTAYAAADPVGAPDPALQKLLTDAHEEQSLYKEHEDGLVPLARLYDEARKRDPSLTLGAFHNQLLHMRDGGQMELHVLNEVAKAGPDAGKSMWVNDRLLHYAMQGRNFGTPPAAPPPAAAPQPENPQQNPKIPATAVDKPDAQGGIDGTGAGGSAPADAGGGTMGSQDGRLLVGGDTYPHKDALRAAGGEWDAGGRAWIVPAGTKLPAGLSAEPLANTRLGRERRYAALADESGVIEGHASGLPSNNRATLAEFVGGKKDPDPEYAALDARTGLWAGLHGGLSPAYAADELIAGGHDRAVVLAAAREVLGGLAGDGETDSGLTPETAARRYAELSRWVERQLAAGGGA